MTLFASNLTSDAGITVFVERIGWVLIHSLWLFTVLALALIVVERLLMRRSAASRYLASAAALGLMVVGTIVTFLAVGNGDSAAIATEDLDGQAIRIGEIGSRPTIPAPAFDLALDTALGPVIENVGDAGARARLAETGASDEHGRIDLAESANPDASVAEQFTDLRTSFATAMRPWLPGCVMVWLVGVAVAALRLVAGGLNVRRLRRHGLLPVSDDVLRVLATTAERLGLRRAVAIAESSLVSGPVVIGWLKPLILLPATSLTGLTTEQLEAVLAHELAHVRRLDYVTNLVQTIIETIFFYHPAVWWVSRRMRIHREDCCDDRAVSIVATRLSYASALLALYDQHDGQPVPRSVVALSATGGSLKKRIHRVLALDEPLQSGPGWWLSTGIVGVVVVLAGCGLFAQSPTADQDQTGEAVVSESEGVAAEPLVPVPDPVGTVGAFPSVPLPPAAREEDREQVYKQLEQLGVSRRSALNIKQITTVLPHAHTLNLRNVPEAAWPLLGRLYMAGQLDLSASRVSPEAFRHVAGMVNLRQLQVVNSRFEPQHLEALASLKRLQTIDVMLSVFQHKSEVRQAQLGDLSEDEQQRFNEIAGPDNRLDHIAQAAILTDRALLKLSELKELRTLRLVNTFVSNVGVLALSEKQQLEKVELSVGGTLTREAAAVFGNMPKLEELILVGAIDGTAAEGLKPATALKRLELRSIDDDVAAVVAELPNLEWLRLWASSLSDAGLMELTKLEKLKHLDIRNAFRGTLTPSGIERFQSARPGCAVVHDLTVESLAERKVPLPADHFIVRLHWRKATSRQQLAEHMQKRFGESEHWVEFRPLTRAGFVGGIVLLKGGETGRDWLLAQLGTDGDYDVTYSELISYQRLKNEGVLFNALLRPTGGSPGAEGAVPARERNAPTKDSSANKLLDSKVAAGRKPSGFAAPDGLRRSANTVGYLRTSPNGAGPDSVLLPGESFPPFQELLARLRERGYDKTATDLQARYDRESRTLSRVRSRKNAVIAYGQVLAKPGEPRRLCNAPMKIFEGGWFVAGIGDIDRPVGFRMAGCRPVDVVPSKAVPGVEAGSVISLGQIVMDPYAETELVTVRGRLKFSDGKVPGGIRARVIIKGGPTNSLTGGTDGFLEWPEKENVTLADDLRFEHRWLSPLPHRLHIETPGYHAIKRDLELTAGSTLDLGTIEIQLSPKFRVQFLAAETGDFTESKLRSVTVPLNEVWKSNPDNEALRKYSGGDMRFMTFPVDRKNPHGEQKLIFHSGVASLKLADLGTGELDTFRKSVTDPPKLESSRDTTVESGHVYLTYHTHWKHWTLLRVVIQ